MRRFPFLLALAVALTAGSVPATADVGIDGGVRVDLQLFDTAGGVYALVVVESTWGRPVVGDLAISLNGNDVALHDVATTDRQFVGDLLADGRFPFEACATLRAAIDIYGDSDGDHAVAREDCESFVPGASRLVSPVERGDAGGRDSTSGQGGLDVPLGAPLRLRLP